MIRIIKILFNLVGLLLCSILGILCIFCGTTIWTIFAGIALILIVISEIVCNRITE